MEGEPCVQGREMMECAVAPSPGPGAWLLRTLTLGANLEGSARLAVLKSLRAMCERGGLGQDMSKRGCGTGGGQNL